MAPPIFHLVRRDDPPSNATAGNGSIDYNPGSGSRAAASFNNNLFFIFFAVIAAGLALLCIWFFTMSKHGGFHWKKTDWDDYKSTVLRRKGPDGKTLSNATKSTRLGGGSIVPKWAADKSINGSKSDFTDEKGSEVSCRGYGRTAKSDDPELDAYQNERPAGVGGLNKPDEGSHYDYTNTDPSTASGPNSKPTRKQKKEQARKTKEQKEQKEQKKHKNKRDVAPPPPPHSTAQSASTHNSSSYHGVPQDSPSAGRNSYYSSYRPQQTSPHTPGQTVRAVHEHSSPASRGSPQRRSHGARYEESAYSIGSEGRESSYVHHVEGLTKGEVGVHDSISQVGANRGAPPKRYGNGGYRRT